VTFERLVATYYGKQANSPYGLGGQCTDWCNLYLGLVRGIPHVYRDAVNWSLPIPGLRFTPNTPANMPPLGAIVVWGPDAATGVGAAGHVAIALLADAESFLSLDQNWGGQYVHSLVHNYSGVLGWQT
jgi:hypothetical protein